MTQREKLIDLLETIVLPRKEIYSVAEIADFMIDFGVVVLPCKAGATVYLLKDICDFPADCYTKRRCNGCEYRQLEIEEVPFDFNLRDDIGKTVFLTREEAEAALKKMEGEK